MNGLNNVPDAGATMLAAYPSGCSYEGHNHGSNAASEVQGSFAAPIKVKELHHDRYVRWEYSYISKKLLYHKCLQQLLGCTDDPDRRVDRVVVRDYGGKHHVYYFDVTEPLLLDNKRFDQVMKDYEAGKPIDPKDKASIERAQALQDKFKRRKWGRG